MTTRGMRCERLKTTESGVRRCGRYRHRYGYGYNKKYEIEKVRGRFKSENKRIKEGRGIKSR